MLNNSAAAYGAAGRPKDSLACLEEEQEIFRRLAKTNPDAQQDIGKLQTAIDTLKQQLK
jgi:hypothetical protein